MVQPPNRWFRERKNFKTFNNIMSKKPVRQDYISKVRYLNNLPPPPLNPKFIKYHTTEKISNEEESNQIISSLFRKENFKNLIENIDEDFGMELNLINNPGVLDNDDFKSISRKELELHPSDQFLLRDAGIGKISKSRPEVSFLRRTEYIAERTVPKATSTNNNVKKVEEKFDSESQLKVVEETFESSQKSLKDLGSLKHPSKRGLKAVSTWQLLPDTSNMDSKYLNLKFLGSASFNRDLTSLKNSQGEEYDEPLQNKILETSIFKPITSADGEWMSLYQQKPNDEVNKLHEQLNAPTVPDDSEFKFKFVKNYDMKFQKFDDSYKELAIKFISNDQKKRKIGYYYPINGKIDLKTYRTSTNSHINKFVDESTFTNINFNLREPSANELRRMDTIRSEFDPMEYEAEEQEEPEEPEAESADAEESQIEAEEEAQEEAEPEEETPNEE